MFMKIRPVEAKLFRADGRTETRTDGQTHRRTDRKRDMIQLTVASGNSVSAPKTFKRERNMQLIYKNMKYTGGLDGDLIVYLLDVGNTKV